MPRFQCLLRYDVIALVNQLAVDMLICKPVAEGRITVVQGFRNQNCICRSRITASTKRCHCDILICDDYESTKKPSSGMNDEFVTARPKCVRTEVPLLQP